MFTPKYTITTALLNHISAIEASKQIIENAPLIPKWERKFIEDAMVRSIHHSTHIEGNPLSHQDAQKIFEGKEEELRAGARDIQEIINYRRAMEFIEYIKSSGGGISKESILKLHSILSEKFLPLQYCGVFRDVKVSLRNSKIRWCYSNNHHYFRSTIITQFIASTSDSYSCCTSYS